MNTTDTTPTIREIQIKTVIDNDVDLSYLGEFTHHAGPEDRTIDRFERGMPSDSAHRYFVAAHGPEETGNPASVEQDWVRMEAYGDEWWCLGIKAVAQVEVNGTVQTLSSAGLWGVQSDAPADYLSEIASNELAELCDTLETLGIEVPAGLEVEWNENAPVRETVKVHP